MCDRLGVFGKASVEEFGDRGRGKADRYGLQLESTDHHFTVRPVPELTNWRVKGQGLGSGIEGKASLAGRQRRGAPGVQPFSDSLSVAGALGLV